jgi:hypothetical protein
MKSLVSFVASFPKEIFRARGDHALIIAQLLSHFGCKLGRYLEI